MSVLLAATLFFAVAAVGGSLLARGHVVSAARPPRALALGHGLLAASGILLLGAAYVRSGEALVAAGLVVLTLTALGGVTLSTLRAKGRALKGLWIAGHATLALTGLALLVAALVTGAAVDPTPSG